MSINQKILNIQKAIDVMPKLGHNDFSNYAYLKEAQVTALIKGLLDKEGVIFSYSSVVEDTATYTGSKGDTQFLVTVKVFYSFIDVETGEKIDGFVVGQGADKGDKGIYKAITGAIKYLYMKTFNIPTGDDPEKESPEQPKVGTTYEYKKTPATRKPTPLPNPTTINVQPF